MGKALPSTTSPILTHTLCGLVLGGQVLLHLLRSPSLALADRTASPEWNTSQHHSVQRGSAVTDTLRRGLAPLPEIQQEPPLLAKALLVQDFQCWDHRKLAVGRVHALPLTSPGHNDTQNMQKGNKQAQSLNNKMLIQFNQDVSTEEHSTTKCPCDSLLTFKVKMHNKEFKWVRRAGEEGNQRVQMPTKCNNQPTASCLTRRISPFPLYRRELWVRRFNITHEDKAEMNSIQLPSWKTANTSEDKQTMVLNTFAISLEESKF